MATANEFANGGGNNLLSQSMMQNRLVPVAGSVGSGRLSAQTQSVERGSTIGGGMYRSVV